MFNHEIRLLTHNGITAWRIKGEPVMFADTPGDAIDQALRPMRQRTGMTWRLGARECIDDDILRWRVLEIKPADPARPLAAHAPAAHAIQGMLFQ